MAAISQANVKLCGSHCGLCIGCEQSDNDKLLLIGCGITLVETMDAAKELEAANIPVRVIDPFTIKPLDKDANAAVGKIIAVQDHYPEGGLGDAVCPAVSVESSITVHKLAVNGLPRSGPSAALLDMFGISSKHVIGLAKKLIAF